MNDEEIIKRRERQRLKPQNIAKPNMTTLPEMPLKEEDKYSTYEQSDGRSLKKSKIEEISSEQIHFQWNIFRQNWLDVFF